jgi:hypothetical protein
MREANGGVEMSCGKNDKEVGFYTHDHYYYSNRQDSFCVYYENLRCFLLQAWVLKIETARVIPGLHSYLFKGYFVFMSRNVRVLIENRWTARTSRHPCQFSTKDLKNS